MRRLVAVEIKHPRRQVELAEVTVATDVDVGLREIEEPDAARAQEGAYGCRRGGIPGQKRGVDSVVEECLGRGLATKIEQPRGPVRFYTVCLEEGQGKDARAAAFRPDCHALPLQCGE